MSAQLSSEYGLAVCGDVNYLKDEQFHSRTESLHKQTRAKFNDNKDCAKCTTNSAKIEKRTHQREREQG